MGFVGSNLVNNLNFSENEITVIDNFSTNVNKNCDGFELINIDLTDNNLLQKIELESADVFIHLAGPSSGPASAKDPKGTIEMSNRAIFNVLELCEKLSVKRFLFASSMAVYGNPKKMPVNEETVCNPISYYSVAKLCAENLIKVFCKTSDLEYSILRFFNIYGPGQDLTRMDQGIVSIYLSMLLNQQPFIIKGRLDRARDLIHIDDIVLSVLKIMDSPAAANQIINICNGEQISIQRLAEILINHFDDYKNEDIIEEQGSPDDIQKIYGSNDKLLNKIGYKPKYNIESGIDNFVTWAKKDKSILNNK